jgi:hypothetical protein
MSFHYASAEFVLQLTRSKLDKEASAGDPRLLRLLVCANVVDMICNHCISINARKSTGKALAIQYVVEETRRNIWQGATHRHQNTTTTTASPPSLRWNKDKFSLAVPHKIWRPQASIQDRTAFRRSLDRGHELVEDSPVESDSDSGDSDGAYSDEDFYDGSDESDDS